MSGESIGKRKKVALVTWLGYGNFGTSLQSYALYQKLEMMGCEVIYLSHYSSFCSLGIIDWIRNCVNYYRFHSFLHYAFTSKGRKLYKFHIEKYKIRRALTSCAEKQIMQSIDVFVSGSDQIWNVSHEYSPFMFLDFVKNKKRVSYASSIGTGQIPEKYRDIVAYHLKKYSSISVREQSLVPYLNELLEENKVQHVVDPTFLLSEQDWSRLAAEAEFDYILPKKYILCYFIGNNPEYQKQLGLLQASIPGCECVIIPSDENKEAYYGEAIYDFAAGPKEFVRLIEGATIVCTDSFHATALSIILSKQFVEFKRFSDDDQTSQNSRIVDLLEFYGLQDRFDLCNAHCAIDYTAVQNKLKQARKESEQYIVANIMN
ncbi:MAG: polysaccharide pyruvyl transferase family protein [Bacteroidaceae bacterium]|nr:polysaccharide pyruvyl transferase family protein [Bacteroidaceae bacterium]